MKTAPTQEALAAIAELEAVEASGPLERAIRREIVRLRRASQPEPYASTTDGVTVRVGDTVFRAAPPRFEWHTSASGKGVRKARIHVERLTISKITRGTYSVEVRFLENLNPARMEQFATAGRRRHGTEYFSTRAAAWEYICESAQRSLSEKNENVKEARKLLELTKKAIAADRKVVARKVQGVRRRARGKAA
jgi:hypothetical protein